MPDYSTLIHMPLGFDDCQDVIDDLNLKKTVVVNLEKLDEETAQRVVDFISGATYCCKGSINKISAGIFLVTPNEAEVGFNPV